MTFFSISYIYCFMIYASYKKKGNIKVIRGLWKAYEACAKYPGKYYSIKLTFFNGETEMF